MIIPAYVLVSIIAVKDMTMKKFLATLLCCTTLGIPLAHGQQPAQKQAHPPQTVILKKGATLPAASRGASVKPSEYKKHKLRAPGKGQKWVKIKGTYVLINNGNGRIDDIGR